MIYSTKSKQLHLDSITDSMDMNLNKFWERVKNKEACCVAVHGFSKSRTQLSDWTTAKRHETHSLHILTHLNFIRSYEADNGFSHIYGN